MKVIVRAGGPTITKYVNKSMWSVTTHFQVFYLTNTLIKRTLIANTLLAYKKLLLIKF